MFRRTLIAAIFLGCCLESSYAVEPKAQGPLTPREELATFKTLPGFQVELVASEPDVIDPVAMCFDERGRLFVCEMIGYPNGGVATGEEKRGRIRMLTDEDGDGVYEKSVIFADGLRFPTGVMPYKGGLIVIVAPDIIYLENTKNTGRADKRRVLYTGFGLDNIQQIVNSPQWGLDNWVYAVAGSNGGTITSPEKPDALPVVLRGRGIRFKPDVPGSLEPTSGGGQYGLAPDDFQHWFVNTNSTHLRQIVLPDHYLRRNPYLSVPAVMLDIPDHGAACKLNRMSPFEGWRVERTTRRKEGPEAKRLPPTELVPGGYVTSSCSPIVYTANLFPREFFNNTFICEPANNLIHRDVLEVKGSVFSAKRGDADCEFLASTDNWFRPVHLSVGPEGAIYVLDFYREVIETPLSLPNDIKARLNLESRQRGRIWRIVPEGHKHAPLARLDRATTAELVAALDDPIAWKRYTAQRLLLERQASDAPTRAALEKLALGAKTPAGKVHALWALHGLRLLDNSEKKLVAAALDDPTPGVRETGLRLAEAFAADADMKKAIALAEDADPFVRLQAALSLGAWPADVAAPVLVKLLERPDADSWLQSAVLSSAANAGPAMLEAVLASKKLPPATVNALATRLAAMFGAQGRNIGKVLALVSKAPPDSGLPSALLDGLGQGTRNSAQPLQAIWESPPPELKDAIEQALPIFASAAVMARDVKRTPAQRLGAIRLLTSGPKRFAIPTLIELLGAQQPLELQTGAVRALASRREAEATPALLNAWNQAGPSLRGELLEAIFARPDRIAKLLDAFESKKITPSQVDAARIQFLKAHPDLALRRRAATLLAGLGDSDRQKAVEAYKDALDLKADAGKGKMVFAKNCAACHRLENVGTQVGANLEAALRTKSKQALLIDILDPSREVDTRYVNYRITTLNGQTYTGIIAVETPASITLRRAEKAEDTVLRSQIDEIVATSKSLMPDEFEKQLSKQDLADLIGYLLEVVK
jgi:putative membrane-bound dehydrogenase-like protein